MTAQELSQIIAKSSPCCIVMFLTVACGRGRLHSLRIFDVILPIPTLKALHQTLQIYMLLELYAGIHDFQPSVASSSCSHFLPQKQINLVACSFFVIPVVNSKMGCIIRKSDAASRLQSYSARLAGMRGSSSSSTADAERLLMRLYRISNSGGAEICPDRMFSGEASGP